MLEILKQDNFEILFNLEITPPKNNLCWGADYMFMDSNTRNGGIGGVDYDVFIDMFLNIWKIREYGVLENIKPSITL